MNKLEIPEEVVEIAAVLHTAGFKSFVVGGCVRDLLLRREPKDWDIATDAKPEEIQKLFPESVYENEFGTVGVKTDSTDPTLEIIEVTTFRREENYSDLRHPDKIEFASTIDEDLGRRDFTVNAIAISIQASPKSDDGRWLPYMELRQLVDPYNGIEDLKNQTIRAVRDPSERFHEDALRLIRAVRFAAELGFAIHEKTAAAIKESTELLDKIAKERVRDELIKIIMSPNRGPYNGILLLEELGLLQHVIPELREGIGVTQNKHHIYTVWEHNLLALDYATRKNYSLEVRLASLLHDIGKPRTKEGEGPEATFYGHEFVGAKMTREILNRLHFPKKIVDKVTHLVRSHLFYYNVGEVTAAGVRRFLRRVGEENIDDLLKVREADRIGSGVPKAFPYKLRHLKFMIEKVRTDPISPKRLVVKGDEVMGILKITPGPKVGKILSILLDEVLDEPERNEKSYLEKRIKELGALGDKELETVAKKAKERKEEFESGIEKEMKRRHYVK